MRKHFLILMLMALLPFCGWATDVDVPTTGEFEFIDLSQGWSIRLSKSAQKYTGVANTSKPTIELVKAKSATETYVLSSGFNVTWSPSAPLDVISGGYTVTVTCDDTRTYGELEVKTAKFNLMKETSAPKEPAAVLQTDWIYNLTAPVAKPVLTTPVSVTFGTVQYSIDNKVTWSSTIPTVQEVGTYKVWYKVEGTNNFNGIPATEIGDVKVTGTALVAGDDYTLPTAKTGLTFSWDNGAVAKPLINLGSISAQKGTMKYRFRRNGATAWSAWMTTAPTASNAGEYDVQYMIEGATGYYDVDATPLASTVTIAPKAPASVNSATGIANLQYAGIADPYQPLLSAAGSAADGATSSIKYKVRYKANAAVEWSTVDTWLQQNVADYQEIKGSDAGIYQVVTYVPEAGNYKLKESTPIEVVIAPAAAYTAAPSAKDLTWNNAEQQLINAATDAVTNQVEYLLDTDPSNSTLDGTLWVTDPTTLVGADAGTYHVWYRVTNTNYQVKDPTKIVVTIKNKPISVKVNNVTKIYDGTKNLTDEIYDADGAKAYNATLDGHKTSGDYYYFKTSDTSVSGTKTYYTKAGDEYTEVTTPSVASLGDYYEKYTYNEETAAAYNATLPGAVKALDFKAATNYEVEGGERFTFITPIAGADDFASIGSYKALTDANINAGSYTGVVDIDVNQFLAVNAAKHYFYDYTIIKGNLTVEKKAITVTANDDLQAVFGKAYDISKSYAITGFVTGEDANNYEKVFSTLPVLTTDAPALNPEVGPHNLSFTPGILTNNYKMSTAGDAHNGYVIGDRKFTVTPDPDKQIVITVLPHTQKYTGVAESWDNLVEGVDYIVSGLVAGDKLTKAPTFTRGNADKFGVGVYTLTATGAEVADMTNYPGKFVYNNSTFTIDPVELTATVDQQTIAKQAGVEAANIAAATAALDQDAWTVEGLVNGETKSVLGGALAVYNVGTDPGKTNISTPEFYNNGIKLTIENGNYILKASSIYGRLRVIDATATFEMDPAAADLADQIKAKAAEGKAPTNKKYNVTFAPRTLKRETWAAMVLPFETSVTEISGKLGYAVVDVLDQTKGGADVYLKLHMGNIPANTPFLVKYFKDGDENATLNLENVTFDTKTIVYSNALEGSAYAEGYEGSNVFVKDAANNLFVGTYEATPIWGDNYKAVTASGKINDAGSLTEETAKKYPVEALRAYFKLTNANARIFIEEPDGTTTVIEGVNADREVVNAEGWYTLNGVKLNAAPSQKGIYINNGKKVVVK